MNRKSLIGLLAVSMVAVAIIGLKCGDDPPDTPGAPLSVLTEIYQRASAGFKVATTQPQDKAVLFVMDWGDGMMDTTDFSYASGETATVYHSWPDVGDYDVKAMALLDDNPELVSDWSEATTVTILANNAPAKPAITGPGVVPKGRFANFRATTTDEDGDSVSFKFSFTNDWTPFVPSGGTVRDSNRFTSLETTYVTCIAKDIKGSESDESESLMVVVDTVGVVTWWWITPDEDEGPPLTSPVVLVHGTDTLAYLGAEDEDGKFYAISTGEGRKKGTASPVVSEYWFTGHPGYCAATGHIIVGNEDGELYAIDKDTRRDWHWPGYTREDSLTEIEWGSPAITGNKLYVPRDNDSLYYFVDNGATGTFMAAYFVPGIVDAPVIDNNGYVYFGTDSGFVYKMPPDLSAPSWRKLLAANDDIHSPVISGGTIFVGTALGKIYALSTADGSEQWQKQLDGEVFRLAVGTDKVFAVTGFGTVYALNPTSGAEVWKKEVSPSEFLTTPILTANGLMYVQDYDDVVYCLEQSSGTVKWSCNCLDYGPEYTKGGRRRKVDFFEGNPSIAPNGDLIIVGAEALYGIAGYTAGTLATSPWPKWQHDVQNSGKVGGW